MHICEQKRLILGVSLFILSLGDAACICFFFYLNCFGGHVIWSKSYQRESQYNYLINLFWHSLMFIKIFEEEPVYLENTDRLRQQLLHGQIYKYQFRQCTVTIMRVSIVLKDFLALILSLIFHQIQLTFLHSHSLVHFGCGHAVVSYV